MIFYFSNWRATFSHFFQIYKVIENHGVPLVSEGPITRSKSSKIQQSFILHVQEWIWSVHHEFHVPHTNTRDEGPFGVLKVNVFSIEVDCGRH